MQLILAENFRAVFYAPFYATLALGLFAERGLDISLHPSPEPGSAIRDMVDGAVHVVWGGPLRVIKDRERVPEGPQALVAFGEVVGRDPFFLIGDSSLSPFSLASLSATGLASVSEVQTPWICLQQDLRDLNIDPDSIRRIDTNSMTQNLRLLASGQVKVVQIFEPYVSLAEREGALAVLHGAHARGETAYTSFITTEEHLNRFDSEFRAMCEAVSRFPAWLAQHGTAELVKVVESFYPDVERGLLKRSFDRCQKVGLWGCQPQISRKGFHRLAQSMLSAGFISREASYEQCVASWAQEGAA